MHRFRLAQTALGLLALLGVFASPADAVAAGTVYVSNEGCCGGPPPITPMESSVSQYGIDASGLLSPLSPPTVGTAIRPRGIAISPDGKSAYIACQSSAACQYDIDPQSGVLAPKDPATVPAGEGSLEVAVTPDGKNAYVVNAGSYPEYSATVSQYSIDRRTGDLSPKRPATVAVGPEASAIAVTPDGKSAYVAGGDYPEFPDGAIFEFDINSHTGTLSKKTPAAVAAGQLPDGIALTPDGKSAYVSNIGRSVSQYTVSAQTGQLSPKTPATVAAGTDRDPPVAVAVTPDGSSAYVVSFGFRGPGTISQFSIDPVSGALSPKTPASFDAEQGSNQIAVTSDGRSAYVTNLLVSSPGTISQFSIDPQTGALSPKAPPTVAGGPGPWFIVVRPPPGVPIGPQDCKDSGWRKFPQFKDQGQCVDFVERGRT
jgi:6-phosphogluconolactonase